jgi:hypothetical protein
MGEERRRELEAFRRFIFNSIDDLVSCLDGLSADELNWRPPAPATNSLYVLATHVLGNAEENLLGALCGLPARRDREAEFSALGSEARPVRERWRELRVRIEAALAELPVSELDRERVHPRRGSLTGREVLLVVARHAAEHWGHAQLTRDLLKARGGGIVHE